MMRMMAFLDQPCRLDSNNSRVHPTGVCVCGGVCFILFLDGGYFMFRKLLTYCASPGNLYWDRLCLQGFVKHHMKMMMKTMKVAMLSLDLLFLPATKLIPPVVRTRMLLGPCLPEGLTKTPWHTTLSAEHEE